MHSDSSSSVSSKGFGLRVFMFLINFLLSLLIIQPVFKTRRPLLCCYLLCTYVRYVVVVFQFIEASHHSSQLVYPWLSRQIGLSVWTANNKNRSCFRELQLMAPQPFYTSMEVMMRVIRVYSADELSKPWRKSCLTTGAWHASHTYSFYGKIGGKRTNTNTLISIKKTNQEYKSLLYKKIFNFYCITMYS